LIETLTVVC